MDLHDIWLVDGVFEDVCARFDQVEVIVLDLAAAALFAGNGVSTPELVSKLMVELACSRVPFFELLCVVESLNEKLLLVLGVQPLPEFLQETYVS